MICIKSRRFFNRHSSNLKLAITAILFITSTFIITGHFTIKEFLTFTLDKLTLESTENEDILDPIKLPENVRKHHGLNHLGTPKNDTVGLTTHESHFYLNNKRFRIFSGEMHYFRVPSSHWRHRLMMLKASGLNTVSSYVPWNGHEPEEDEFHFEGIYDLEKFVKLVHELELKLVVRIGPYICAEWEWGGLPAWLLRDPNMKTRVAYKPYQNAVENYFKKLSEILIPYQFTNNGPIIAFQVENEYGGYPDRDTEYLPWLRDLMLKLGLNELHFTCDDSNGIKNNNKLNGVLAAINSQENIEENLNKLKVFQPHEPLYIAEYWVGWFDWWGDKHHELGFPWRNKFSVDVYEKTTKEILSLGASFNMFMFIGGTNFGFMNGAIYQGNTLKKTPDTTSYDYTAPVSEGGRVNHKFNIFQELMKNSAGHLTKTSSLPEELVYGDYGKIVMNKMMSLKSLLSAVGKPIRSETPVNMENLDMSNFVNSKISDSEYKNSENQDSKNNFGKGQYYGYTFYESTIHVGRDRKVNIHVGDSIRDRAIIHLEQTLRGIATSQNPDVTVNNAGQPGASQTLSFLVENVGRHNWVNPNAKGLFNDQRKGIVGEIKVNSEVLKGFKIWPLDFRKSLFDKLDSDVNYYFSNTGKQNGCPALFRAEFVLRGAVKNTFLKFDGWGKGVAFVNGFNVGRYNKLGPQKSLFVPDEFLIEGKNVIYMFEEEISGGKIVLQKEHVLK